LGGIVDVGADLMLWLFAVAGAGLGLLGCVFGAASRYRHRALARRIAEIEEARRSERARLTRQARLHAFIEQEVEVRWFLTIHNQGPAKADNLTASINGTPLDNCPLIDPKQCDLAALGAVGAHRGVRIPLSTSDRPAELQVELTWSDQSGELGFYQTTLPDHRSADAGSEPHPALGRQSDPSSSA